jgi:hypothetical protein
MRGHKHGIDMIVAELEGEEAVASAKVALKQATAALKEETRVARAEKKRVSEEKKADACAS